MPILRRSLLRAFPLFLAAALRAAIPFPQAESDLHPDPAAHFGTLPNGMRYVVMANHEPRNRASLRLLVLAGSLEETGAQRGLAHFLEHMAFNGSAHYAPGTLVELLQRLGMSFGADTNAATSFDHTIYQLELPDTKPATLDQGLGILDDYAGSLLLKPAMIEKERGIILSEKRTRDSVGYRTFEAEFGFMLNGTRVPERMPIGLTGVIEKSGREPFADFYDTWYRPELETVIVVGDIDAAAVEKLIVGTFSGLAPRAPGRPKPGLGAVDAIQGIRVLYHPEPEAPDTQVAIAAVTPYAREPDTAAIRLKYLPRSLALAMLNQRLSILAKKENAPFLRANADAEEEFNFVRDASIEVECKADQWAAALAVAEQELRRALTLGFQPSELKEAVADYRNALEQAAKTVTTRRSEEIAGDLAESLVDENVFTSPVGDLSLYAGALDRVSAEDCARALRQAWSAPGRKVFVAGNAVIGGDASAAIAAAYARSAATPVSTNEVKASAAWAYSGFGAPGKVADRRHVDDLDVTLVSFANGVRLNLKKTDFEANTIHVALRAGTGKLTEPAAQPGLATFADMTFMAGGLGRHSADDLERILAGRTVSVEFRVGGDACEVAGQTNRDDLDLQLQLLAAYLTDPGYRPEALRVARKEIERVYTGFEHTADGPLKLEVPRLLANGDPRFGLPSREVLLSRTPDEARAWLGPQLARGALEIAVVGDFDVDAAIAAVARTFGALPARDPRPALDELRHVSFPSEPFTRTYAFDSRIQKGVVALFWPTTDALEIHRTRRMALLSSVFSDRLRVKVREQLGSAYSPSASSRPSEIYPGYGMMVANAVVDPAKAAEIEAAVASVAADLSGNGVTDDELSRAKNPILTSIRESERTNQYWLFVLGRAQEKPEVLDWSRSRSIDFQAITKPEIDALAALYLPPARASRVIVTPLEKPAK